jgi:hypothetical protein
MNNYFLFAEIALQLAVLTARAEGSFYSRELAKDPSSRPSEASGPRCRLTAVVFGRLHGGSSVSS